MKDQSSCLAVMLLALSSAMVSKNLQQENESFSIFIESLIA